MRGGLSPEALTIAEILRELEYHTVITGKWHLGHSKRAYLPTNQGFIEQYGSYGNMDQFTHLRSGAVDWSMNDKALDQVGYSTTLIGQMAVKKIHESRSSETPLFLYVPFHAVHRPLQAPQEYIDRFTHIKDERRRLASAMLTVLDEEIGNILKAVNESGMEKDTVVFFISDNGGDREPFSNGELRGEKTKLYEGGIRVPAAMSWKGHLKKGVFDKPIHITDVLPTVLGILEVEEEALESGLGVVPKFDGINMWPEIKKSKKGSRKKGFKKGSKKKDNTNDCSYAKDGRTIILNAMKGVGHKNGVAAVMRWPFKLSLNAFHSLLNTRGSRQMKWELFHLENDPYENENLIDTCPRVAQELKGEVTKAIAESVRLVTLPMGPAEWYTPPKGYWVPGK
jgi:arylsulfatase A-like enzyme